MRDKPPNREECATLERRAREFPTGFKATNARAFGTAALVDGSSRLGQLTTLWALDEGGRWKFLVANRGAQLGTRPSAQSRMRAT